MYIHRFCKVNCTECKKMVEPYILAQSPFFEVEILPCGKDRLTKIKCPHCGEIFYGKIQISDAPLIGRLFDGKLPDDAGKILL